MAIFQPAQPNLLRATAMNSTEVAVIVSVTSMPYAAATRELVWNVTVSPTHATIRAQFTAGM